MNKHTHPCWNRFVEEGKELFDYLIHNYKIMIDGNTIKHFNIREGMCWLNEYVREINIIHKNDIQYHLIPWITKEIESGNIFKHEHWKPFPDDYAVTDMFFGYKKLFKYNQYWFQLALEWGCQNDNCMYCKNGDYYPNFCLAFYGWKDELYKNLQPHNVFAVSEDAIMPESYWNMDN
jgi:hypothetical protein